jgi:hypothetical protein
MQARTYDRQMTLREILAAAEPRGPSLTSFDQGNRSHKLNGFNGDKSPGLPRAIDRGSRRGRNECGLALWRGCAYQDDAPAAVKVADVLALLSVQVAVA